MLRILNSYSELATPSATYERAFQRQKARLNHLKIRYHSMEKGQEGGISHFERWEAVRLLPPYCEDPKALHPLQWTLMK